MTKLSKYQNYIEDYIRNIKWSEDTPDIHKTLVAGNIRAFAQQFDLDQLSPDVDALAQVIQQCEFKNSMNTTDKILAQEIINKMSEWIVKKR